MTDITKLNLKIAEIKKIKVKKVTRYLPASEYYIVDENGFEINYTTDPKLILENVIELGLAGWKYFYDEGFHVWNKLVMPNYSSRVGGKVSLQIKSDKDFGIAAGLAYLEIKNG